MSQHFWHELGTVPLPHNYLAVDFFFILSGFVLAHAYEDRLLGGMTPTQFMHLRLIRLYPLYLIGMLIGIATATAVGRLGWPNEPNSWLSVLSALLFLPDPSSRSDAYPLNAPAWSLFFELTVNAAYAIGIRKLSNRFLIIIAFLSLAVLAACYGNLKIGSSWANFIGGFPRVCFGFFVGVLTYRIWSTATWRPSLPQWTAPGLAIALLLILDVSSFDLVAVLVFPFIVYCGASREPSLRTRAIFLWLGGISYALYITHVPLLQAARFAAGYFSQAPLRDAAPWAGLAIGAGAVILAAVLSSIDPALRRILMAGKKGAVVTAIRPPKPTSLTLKLGH
jgi:peptidoglycan/LPS O-acetylase OafA/YrhL